MPLSIERLAPSVVAVGRPEGSPEDKANIGSLVRVSSKGAETLAGAGADTSLAGLVNKGPTLVVGSPFG